MMTTLDSLYSQSLEQASKQAYDYVVVGAGAYGTSFAHRILERDTRCRVLVLDKGGYLLPTHIQNLPPAYVNLNQTAGARPWTSTGDKGFMPQIPYIGGRALLWNAWIPQPSMFELPGWPAQVVRSLIPEWFDAGAFVGRRYDLSGAGNDALSLSDRYRNQLFAGLSKVSTALPTEKPSDLDSSMAIGHGVSRSSWAKFSPVEVLVADLDRYSGRLAVVSHCEVERLHVNAGLATGLMTTQGELPLRPESRVVLASSTLEASTILLKSLPDNRLVGKNLSGHIRSWLAFRIHKSKITDLHERFQACAFYVPGWDPKLNRFMHTHISVIFNPHPADDQDILYRTLPDASSGKTVRLYDDSDHVVFNLHAMGEFLGAPNARSWNYVAVKDGETIVHVSFQQDDLAFWSTMDETLYQFVELLTGNAEVEYQQDDEVSWGPLPPRSMRNQGLVHESGTLWMGADPSSSVTDHSGAVHDAQNVFGTGGMLFPRPGSWNPTFTGIALAYALARRFAP